MNTLIQLTAAFASAAAAVGAVAVTAQVAPDPVPPPAATAAAKSTPSTTEMGEALRAEQRRQEAWRSTQDHFRQMDRIRARSW